MDERALLIANIYLVDCLDKEVAIYNPEFTFLIEKYAFDAKCLTHSLFKILQIYTEIFVAEGLGNPESEFKYLVEKNELTGLRFEKMRSSQ